MGSPAKFGRLETLADKTVDRPGVDELVPFFSDRSVLGIAFGDMNDPDVQLPCQGSPVFTCGRSGVDTVVFGDIKKCLLEETGYHTRICALTYNCGRPSGVFAAEFECGFAQGIIGACRSGRAGIGIAAFPGFDGCVDIQYFFFSAEFNQGYTGYENGQIDQKSPFSRRGSRTGR